MLHPRLYYSAIIVAYPVGLAWAGVAAGVYLASVTGSDFSLSSFFGLVLLGGTAVSTSLILLSWKAKERVLVKIFDGAMVLEDTKSGTNWTVTKVQSEYPMVVFVTTHNGK